MPNIISELELVDSPLLGKKFTWSNKRDSPSMKKLDKFLFSTGWKNQFPLSLQKALSSQLSDHCSICLDSDADSQIHKLFHLEKVWL